MIVTLAWTRAQEAAVAAEEDESAGYVILLDERRVSVNRDGEKKIRLHRILEIRKPAAIEQVAEIHIPYNSYREKATFVRAATTVGEIRYQVDPDSVRDLLSVESSDFSMYSDARDLSFSMPSVQVGAILEYEVEIKHHRPVMEDHAWDSFAVQSWVPVKEARYILKTPKRMELNLQLRHLDVEPEIDTGWRSVTRTWVIHDIPAMKWEMGMPPWQDVVQTIRWTTLSAWDELQTWYSGISQRKAAATPELKAKVLELLADCTTPDEKVRALYLFMQKEIRYVGLELGRSAYEPHEAAACLGNLYGDCKDQSVLLVTMLREAGFDAYMALVLSVFEGEVDPTFPSPAAFNHMIVYVPHESGDFWLDSTVKYLDERSHPAQLDNARALIIGHPEEDFLTIPPVPPEHAVTRRIYEVQLSHDGYARIKEIDEMTGRAGASTRVFHENMDKSKRREVLQNYVRGIDPDAQLIDYGHSDPYDLSQPCQDWTLYERYGFLQETESGLGSHISAESLQDSIRLPDPELAADKSQKPRHYPWMSHVSRGDEIICIIHLPPTMSLVEALPSFEAELPQGRLKVEVYQNGRTVHAYAGVFARPARLEPDELPQQRLAVQDAVARSRRTISLNDEISLLLSEKKPDKARARMDVLVKEFPDRAGIHHQRGTVYQACGRFHQARQSFRRAIELEPTRLAFYTALAQTWAGYTGYYSAGVRHQKMVDIYEEALAHVHDKTGALWDLAEVYEHDDEGNYLSSLLTTHDQAIEVYKRIITEAPEDVAARLKIGEIYLAKKAYSKAREWFKEALAKAPDAMMAKQGLWKCDAHAGKVDEAILAIRTALGDHDQQRAELQRLGVALFMRRHYHDAARMLEVASRLDNDNEELAFWLDAATKLSKQDPVDYATYLDRSTPLNTYVSLAIALQYGRTEALRETYSPRLQVTERELQEAFMAFEPDPANDRAFAIDMQRLYWETAEQEIYPGYVQLTLTLPESSSRFLLKTFESAAQLTVLVEQDGDQWRIACLGKNELLPAFLARLAVSLLEEGKLEPAVFFADRIRSLIRRNITLQNQHEVPIQVANVDFPDDQTMTKAIAAIILQQHPRDRKAIPLLEELVEQMPEELAFKRALAAAYRQANLHEKACDVYADIVASDNQDARSLLHLASSQVIVDRYEDTLDSMDRLSKLLPSAHLVDTIKLSILLQAQRPEDAEAVYSRCKNRMQPLQRWQTELKLATLLRDEQRLRKLAEKPPKMEYSFLSPEMFLIEAWFALGNSEDAIAMCERKVQDAPYDLETLRHLAHQLIYRGEWDEARDIYQRICAGFDLDEISDAGLGALALTLGDYQAAERYLAAAKASQRPSESVYTTIYLGLVRAVQGDDQGARDYFHQALEVNPADRWPEPLINMLAGTIPIEDAINAADAAESDLLRLDRRCEAYFYAGMHKVVSHPKQAALLLKASFDTNSYVSREHLMARGMLETMKESNR